MIWDPHSEEERGENDIASHVAAHVEAFCGDSQEVNVSNTAQLAKAVEHFVQENAAGSYVNSSYLLTLASQALSSMGEAGAARRLFLFGTDLVAPSEWEVRGEDHAMWVLDLNRMTVRDDTPMELVFFRSLNVILDSIADIWDSSDGSGTLGLKNVCASASALAGEGAKKNILLMADEIRRRCRRKLDQIAVVRGWVDSPEIMNMDVCEC